MSALHAISNPLSESVEMYLKTAFELGAGGEFVPISAVADRLRISPVSATEMVHRLQDEGLVEHAPYRGVRLSDLGLGRAEQVLRRHRLWECFLYSELGLDWVEVHDLACALEHAVDQSVTEPLATRLGHPARCPHGNPIPGEPRPDSRDELELGELAAGESGEIIRIRPERTDVLDYLGARGLRPGAAVTLRSREPLDGTLTLSHGDSSFVVGQSVASHVVIRKLPSPGASVS